MRKVSLIALFVGACFLGVTAFAYAKDAKPAAQKVKSFSVYTDKNSPDNHYIPSGWMGDYGDIAMVDSFTDGAHGGSTCIKFNYKAKKTQGQGWAGVYWQNPANNWGSKKGGFDLTGLNKLTFWAKGAKGTEVIQKLMVGGISGIYKDSAEIDLGPVELKNIWQQYTINLSGKDLSYISGGFGWVMSADQNPDGAEFYLDDIKFEFDPKLKIEAKASENIPFYVYEDRGSRNNHYIPSGWMGDYGDLKIDQSSTDSPFFGPTCTKIVYSGAGTQGARWAGVYWQNPANNWGDKDGVYDLSKATKLTFWAKGSVGGERIEEFKIGGIMGEYPDSDTAGIGPVILTKEWKQYTIDLKGKDLTRISGGFCWATNVDVNPKGATFYLDEIKYE